MNKDELVSTAQALVARGKGILAADESAPTIAKRFSACGIESSPQTRRDYRELLFRSKDAVEQNISGVILFDETIRQQASDGVRLVEIIEAAGAIPGIKVDTGAKPLANYPGETITEGLDGLRERLSDYRDLGARFAKWRAVIGIDAHIPTPYAADANASALARYSALCQEAGLVPIVEPEVLMDRNHDIGRCAAVTEFVLKRVFTALSEARVLLEGIILKPTASRPSWTFATSACRIGSGNSQNPEAPHALADYARAFAERYNWVRYCTPVNEMYVCVKLSALEGLWNEQRRDERAFVTATRHLAAANVLMMQTIAAVRPDAIFVNSESSEFFQRCCPDPTIRRKADFENQRRFLALSTMASLSALAMLRTLFQERTTAAVFSPSLDARSVGGYMDCRDLLSHEAASIAFCLDCAR